MNAIQTILNLRASEKNNQCIQHQSASGNKALIMAFVVYKFMLGEDAPTTGEIIGAMNKSQPMISKYLGQLKAERLLRPVYDEYDQRLTRWELIRSAF